jgi:hypothetical protein
MEGECDCLLDRVTRRATLTRQGQRNAISYLREPP